MVGREARCPGPGARHPLNDQGPVHDTRREADERVVPTSRVHQILTAALSEYRTDRHGRTLPDILCEAGAAQLPVSGVGMILMSQTGPELVVAATDGPATVLEQLQLSLGEGPCVDASTWAPGAATGSAGHRPGPVAGVRTGRPRGGYRGGLHRDKLNRVGSSSLTS